jgi:hypothetical protein
MHYGTFSYNNNAALTTKRGFCLQSTNRLSNNEYSPLHNPYPDCHYQGVEVGWVDEYKAGLPCQWIDVTSQKGGTTGPLKFVSNPDGFLCEGTPILDAQGNQTWTPTNFTTSTGQPVDKPACTYSPGWFDNNTDQYNVTLPNNGDGYVTLPCTHDQLGPLRNCGIASASSKLSTCTPGAKVTLQCTVPTGSAPQLARICEGSKALGAGVACTFQDALANVTVQAGASTPVTFTCPAGRDSVETGGAYALYGGAVFADDKAATITCQ